MSNVQSEQCNSHSVTEISIPINLIQILSLLRLFFLWHAQLWGYITLSRSSLLPLYSSWFSVATNQMSRRWLLSFLLLFHPLYWSKFSSSATPNYLSNYITFFRWDERPWGKCCLANKRGQSCSHLFWSTSISFVSSPIWASRKFLKSIYGTVTRLQFSGKLLAENRVAGCHGRRECSWQGVWRLPCSKCKSLFSNLVSRHAN